MKINPKIEIVKVNKENNRDFFNKECCGEFYTIKLLMQFSNYSQEYVSDSAISNFYEISQSDYREILIEHGGKRIGNNIYFQNKELLNNIDDYINSIIIMNKLAKKG